MNVEGQDLNRDGARLRLPDRWIRARLRATIERVQAAFAGYRLDLAAAALYEFTWNDFCDWYLELSKAVLQSEGRSEAEKRGTRVTLITTLETLLRALHPLAPFITDEIWMRVRDHAGAAGETVMRAPYPDAKDFPSDPDAEREMSWVRDFILGLRQIRGEMDIAPSRKIDVLLRQPSAADLQTLARNRGLLERLAGIATLGVLQTGQSGPISAVALLGTLEILVPMAGLIDPEAEIERLTKRQRKTDLDIGRLQAKLSDEKFAANAPPDVVAKDTQRLAELRAETSQLAAQAARVRALMAP
jgi:valyl-tRNA synthetase